MPNRTETLRPKRGGSSRSSQPVRGDSEAHPPSAIEISPKTLAQKDFPRYVEPRAEEQSSYLKVAYLQALTENNPMAVVVLDANRRIQMCNPAFELLFGYPSEEVLTQEL